MDVKVWRKRCINSLPYIFVILMSLLMPVRALEGDEVWNFNFARNIYMGMLPYKEFSMLQTPLSAYIAALFFRIFGISMFTYRILGCLLFCSIFSLLYKIGIKVAAQKIMFVSLWVYVMSTAAICWIYNYNYLNVLVILVIISLELSEDKKGKNVVIGLLFGCTFLIKQSTGMMLILANMVLCLYDMYFAHKSKKSMLLRMTGSVIPAMLFFLYAYQKGFLYDFWDYTVLGVGTFTHRYTIGSFLMNYKIWALMALLPFTAIAASAWAIRKNTATVSGRQMFAILIISMAGGTVAYPLTDLSHITAAVVPYIVCLCCNVRYSFSRLDNLCMQLGSIAICAVIAHAILGNTEGMVLSKLNYYQGILIDGNLEESISQIDNYILEMEAEGKTVLIADESAAAYMIPIGKYHANFDMLLVGNLGTRTVEDLLNQVPDAIYLVKRGEGQLGMQTHAELIHRIKETYVKIGEVERYDAYVKSQ